MHRTDSSNTLMRSLAVSRYTKPSEGGASSFWIRSIDPRLRTRLKSTSRPRQLGSPDRATWTRLMPLQVVGAGMRARGIGALRTLDARATALLNPAIVVEGFGFLLELLSKLHDSILRLHALGDVEHGDHSDDVGECGIVVAAVKVDDQLAGLVDVEVGVATDGGGGPVDADDHDCDGRGDLPPRVAALDNVAPHLHDGLVGIARVLERHVVVGEVRLEKRVAQRQEVVRLDVHKQLLVVPHIVRGERTPHHGGPEGFLALGLDGERRGRARCSGSCGGALQDGLFGAQRVEADGEKGGHGGHGGLSELRGILRGTDEVGGTAVGAGEEEPPDGVIVRFERSDVVSGAAEAFEELGAENDALIDGDKDVRQLGVVAEPGGVWVELGVEVALHRSELLAQSFDG